MIDDEIRAMDRAWSAVRSLPPDARRRVIEYLERRAESERAAVIELSDDGTRRPPPDPGLARLGRDWRIQVGHWMGGGKLNKIADRILVVAALLQWEHPGKDFSAKEIHQPLKELGEPVKNIAAHLNSIMERGPKRWIIQVGARESAGHKRYQMTDRGLREARHLIADASGDEPAGTR